MTNEEAKKILMSDADFSGSGEKAKKTADALCVAIEALELVGKTDQLEPVVRCKDCIHAEREGGKLTCPYWMGYYMRGDVVVVEPEGFCSYGDDGEAANDEKY